jgi:hypothetical protein
MSPIAFFDPDHVSQHPERGYARHGLRRPAPGPPGLPGAALDAREAEDGPLRRRGTQRCLGRPGISRETAA